MKQCIKVYLLVFFTMVSMAQNKETKSADVLFNRLEYVDAISEYLKLTQKPKHNTHYVKKQLANAYYNIFDTKNAEYWFSKIVNDTRDIEVYFKYAQMLKANGKYEISKNWMERFANLVPNDLRAVKYLNNPNNVTQLLKKTPKYKVKLADAINTEYSDHGPILHNNKLYFVSSKYKSNKIYGWNDQPYLDIYVCDYNADRTSNTRGIKGAINTRFNEGTISFSPDGKTAYFTRESYNEHKFIKDNTGKSTINIYSAENINGNWINVKELPFNSKTYNTNAPAVSPDGKLLYFSSDMKGGYGDADIWVVEIKGNNVFGEPKNLGPQINTEAREGYPFICTENILYFSSNGHNGLGNLDIYATQKTKEGWSPVRNLGVPINSGKDDFSFTIDKASKKGFFASNRENGIGDDDIYTFIQIQPLCDVELHIRVVHEDIPIVGATVSLFDKSNNKVGEKITDTFGMVSYNYECDQELIITIAKTSFNSEILQIEKTYEIKKEVVIEMKKIPEVEVGDKIQINPIYFPFDKHNITQVASQELDKIVNIMKTYPSVKIEATSHTDFRGSDHYNLLLSDRRAKSTRQYIISKGIDKNRITAEGKGEKEPVVACGSSCTENDHQQNRRSEFRIIAK